MKLSIIIPIFNEVNTLEEIVRQVQSVQYPVDHEIIIVDDASVDKTYQKAAEIRTENLREGKEVRLLKNEVNRGKSFSIRKGIQSSQGDLVLIQDGDMEYDPQDIPGLLEPILKGEADVVCGSRFLKKAHPEAMTLLSWIANKTLTCLTNLLYGLRLTDMESGYKIFKTNDLKALKLRSERFEFDPEAIALLARKGARIVELPIHYHGRTVREGKKINGMDFIEAAWTLIKYRLKPTK
ncbi:MAG: glycosyltransferase family 2 protein [Candidatus Omnitrophota bacterium]